MSLLQDRGNKHNQRNVQGETGRASGTVNAHDLVRIGGDGRGDEAVDKLD